MGDSFRTMIIGCRPVDQPHYHVWKKAKVALLLSNVVLMFWGHYQTTVETLGTRTSLDDRVGGQERQTSSVSPLHRPQTSEQEVEVHYQSYALALQQSLGFFDDIPDQVWRDVHWQRYHRTPRYVHPENPDADVRRRPSSSAWGHDASTEGWLYYSVIPNFSCPYVLS